MRSHLFLFLGRYWFRFLLLLHFSYWIFKSCLTLGHSYFIFLINVEESILLIPLPLMSIPVNLIKKFKRNDNFLKSKNYKCESWGHHWVTKLTWFYHYVIGAFLFENPSIFRDKFFGLLSSVLFFIVNCIERNGQSYFMIYLLKIPIVQVTKWGSFELGAESFWMGSYTLFKFIHHSRFFLVTLFYIEFVFDC